MKIFRIIQKQYAILGISSPTEPTQRLLFITRVPFGFLIFGCLAASGFVYIFRVANGFMEYMACISSIFAGIVEFSCLARIALKKTKIFEIIDNIEKLIYASKPHSQIFVYEYFFGE